MSDLIDRKTVFDVIDKCILEKLEGDTVEIKESLKLITKIYRIPSAQPQRKTGKWINHRNDDGHNIADCDQCGNVIQWFDGDEVPRYCCMCGADMRGESDES